MKLPGTTGQWLVVDAAVLTLISLGTARDVAVRAHPLAFALDGALFALTSYVFSRRLERWEAKRAIRQLNRSMQDRDP